MLADCNTYLERVREPVGYQALQVSTGVHLAYADDVDGGRSDGVFGRVVSALDGASTP
jgi:hypothetical protein